jgi:phosphotriesterase-related protein
VTGSVDVEDVGFVLAHEHVNFAPCGAHFDPLGLAPRAERTEAATGIVRVAREAGVDLIVDPTTPDLGRDLAFLRTVSERTGVRIVAATGLYARWPVPHFAPCSPEQVADYLVSELVDGEHTTGIVPGFVKAATDGTELSVYERLVLDASALAHRETGAPIMVHVEPGGAAAVLQRLCDEAGVPGGSLVVAHAEGTPELADLFDVVDRYGAYAGFDRFGLEEHGVLDAGRVDRIVELCRSGFAARLHLAHDTLGCTSPRHDARWAAMRERNPNWEMTHIPRSIIPRLTERGIAPATLDQLTRANPLSWLTACPRSDGATSTREQ